MHWSVALIQNKFHTVSWAFLGKDDELDIKICSRQRPQIAPAVGNVPVLHFPLATLVEHNPVELMRPQKSSYGW